MGMAKLRRLKSAIAGCALAISCCAWILGDGISSRLNIATQDATVTNWPYKLKVTNGSLTDNSDGTMSLSTGGGSASLPLPPGDTNYIQNRATLQSGATFYVSSGTVVNQLNLTGSGSESAPVLSIGQPNTGFYNSGSGQITFTANGTRRLNFLANGFSSSQNNDSSGMFFSGQDTTINSNNSLIKFQNGVNGNTPMQIDVNLQSVTVGGPLGLNVTFGTTVTTFTVTGSTVILNGVTSSYPSAACLQNQVLVSNGGTSPQLWSCQGQSGTGGGVVGYSGSGVSLASTVYFPIVGGLAPSATESAVDSPSPSGATLANFYSQLSQAVGVGNSVAFTWRKNGVNQSLTCTISGANSDSCSDTSHSFTVSQGDTITIQAVPSGIIGVTPNVIMMTQFGTTGSNGTVNNGTAGQIAYYAAGGTAVSGNNTFTSSVTVAAALLLGSSGNSVTISSNTVLPGTTFYQNGNLAFSGPAMSVNGGFLLYPNTSSGGTITSTMSLVLANCTTASGCIYTLPSASGNQGLVMKVVKYNTTTNLVTVLTNGTDLIAGTTGLWLLPTVNNSLSLVSDGISNWMCPNGCIETPALLGMEQVSNTAQTLSSSQTYLHAISNPYWTTVSTCAVETGAVQNGTSDCGIYDANFNLLAHSGSITQAISVHQKYTWAPINLAPGTYYIGFKATSATATFFRSSINQAPTGYSVSSGETSTTLPATESSRTAPGNAPCTVLVPLGGSQI